MFNFKQLGKWISLTLCGAALCYSLLQTPKAPPLQEPMYGQVQAQPHVFLQDPQLLQDLQLGEHLQEKLLFSTAAHLAADDKVLSAQDEERFLRMNARRGEPLMTPEEFLQARYTPSAILPGREASTATPDSAGLVRETVQFSREKLETLFIGDEMYIRSRTLGDRLIMVVDEVLDHQDGTITWQGHLKDLPRHYNVSFTQGPQFTLAEIDTPSGQFMLEARGERGWLIERELNPDLFRTAGFMAPSPFLSSAIH